ncbi:hypothetical protein P962_01191 [Mycobacterium tuberculosis KT-0077]|uniref:hypothetical protein n=1 Tax=Mycobacterium tuberculosis TaxID=1773 RepID=UPI00045B6D87|nr:hypothetical protein [Mycobacterium tuberculosis]KBM83105.1 hypothetical protein V215_02955 [Mycobacterium tuberculosis KT-0082]KCG66852.1 hypothetical protein P962_01191 [Mycobacterium tuberculosis KT-0077]
MIVGLADRHGHGRDVAAHRQAQLAGPRVAAVRRHRTGGHRQASSRIKVSAHGLGVVRCAPTPSLTGVRMKLQPSSVRQVPVDRPESRHQKPGDVPRDPRC